MREAHEACFRHHFPQSDVEVLLDLADAATYARLPQGAVDGIGARACVLGPPEVTAELSDTQARILELLFMHWDEAELRSLQGGYSGSLLLLADGRKGGSRTEPAVVKVDHAGQMRREIGGYNQVKDLLGKHVPTFGYPVSSGELTGVAMELAAMEGAPETLQECFESAMSEADLEQFVGRLEKSLDLLATKLYGNTSKRANLVPYREFQLQLPEQRKWLAENMGWVLRYHEEEVGDDRPLDPDLIVRMFAVIVANEDSLESEICITHGDLNFQNVICDSAENIWFIDWTFSALNPLELDFTKMENDVKFVMTKEFDAGDLPRLREFEEYLVSRPIPHAPEDLPQTLQFARWDLRFRKMLESVRVIRKRCLDLKQATEGNWLVYRVGLLRYAVHTLSFDKRRERGECDFVQLMHALYATEFLIFGLIADDFHLRIRGERPPSYPKRQQVSLDVAQWSAACPEYDPPYYVDPSVLEAAWADPEDLAAVEGDAGARAERHDDEGRPLNPRGRTGIAGRGLLGRWGPNTSVSVIVTRTNPNTGVTDILLGRKVGQHSLSVPTGFVLQGEDVNQALLRVLEEESGWHPRTAEGEILHRGYSYDPRQTDHAWVEREVRHLPMTDADVPALFRPGAQFEELGWMHLEEDTLSRVVPTDAHFLERLLAADKAKTAGAGAGA